MTRSAAHYSKSRILVVDDIQLNCMVTGAILRSASYEVESVADGAAALAAVERTDFDLILLDLEMPGIGGHDTALTILARENGAVRVAALTSHGGAAERERSRQIGLQAHIARPIASEALLAAVESILQSPCAASDAADAWQRGVYKELVARLGLPRMNGFLRQLADQLDAVIEHLDRDGSHAPAFRRATHDLASASGMMGFLEVMNACRLLMNSYDCANENTVCDTIRQPIARAKTRLEAYLATEQAKTAA